MIGFNYKKQDVRPALEQLSALFFPPPDFYLVCAFLFTEGLRVYKLVLSVRLELDSLTDSFVEWWMVEFQRDRHEYTAARP